MSITYIFVIINWGFTSTIFFTLLSDTINLIPFRAQKTTIYITTFRTSIYSTVCQTSGLINIQLYLTICFERYKFRSRFSDSKPQRVALLGLVKRGTYLGLRTCKIIAS